MKRLCSLLLCITLCLGICLPAGLASAETKDPVTLAIETIAALPKPLTLADEGAINHANDVYLAVPVNDRGKVTNYSDLVQAKKDLAALKKAAEQAKADVVINAINAAFPVAADKREAIEAALKKLNDYLYNEGLNKRYMITNADLLTQAIQTFNDTVGYLIGDVTGDKRIDASDALAVLRFSVKKAIPVGNQKECADVNDDGVMNAEDALQILKYSVKKITGFKAKNETKPISGGEIMITKKNENLFKNTYGSMIQRTHANGYAQTSVTGAYNGMYCRDSSIQIAMHVLAGDYKQAKALLNYMLDYHKDYKYDYVMHVMNENNAPISTKVQTDTTFFFLHAWYLYATKAPESEEKRQFINASIPQIKTFANKFIDPVYFDDTLNLFYNPSLEHSRNNAYWTSYDLLTNTYASQALHELSIYFAASDPTNAKKWGTYADKAAQGIHKNLTDTFEGKKYYCELINTADDNKLIQGFSWVNLAPMGCDWYAADPTILENTYQLYYEYGSTKYYGSYQMLEVVTNFNGRKNGQRNHVIGKGLAWEMMYCKKTGKTERLRLLAQFVEENSDQMYRETWLYSGGGSDTANQEHASWMLLAHIVCFPEVKNLITPQK